MDPLDFSIYRFLSPGGEARFWAGRRVIDPAIPAREIAMHVGISENGVRARLRSLSESGFLRGKAVTPNPSLFGVGVWVAELPVEGPGEVERIYRDLALVEGVVFARDTMDERERQVRVHFVAEGESTARRRAALLHRLSPAGEAVEPQPYSIPPCAQEITPLDWKLLQALGRHPEAGAAEIAPAVGVSLKTAARRLHRLVDSRACWYTHGPDSEELPLALISIEVRDPADRDRTAANIARETASWMPVARDGMGLEAKASATVVAGLGPGRRAGPPRTHGVELSRSGGTVERPPDLRARLEDVPRLAPGPRSGARSPRAHDLRDAFARAKVIWKVDRGRSPPPQELNRRCRSESFRERSAPKMRPPAP